MQINQIQQSTNNCNFNARVIKNDSMEKFVTYLKRNSKNQPTYWNTKEHLMCYKRIEGAIKKHPSQVNVEPDVVKVSTNYSSDGARGVIRTELGEYVNPSVEKYGSAAPYLKVLRDFVNPDNKSMFNALMGKEYSNVYDQWWEQHIKSIWKKVDKLFKDRC